MSQQLHKFIKIYPLMFLGWLACSDDGNNQRSDKTTVKTNSADEIKSLTACDGGMLTDGTCSLGTVTAQECSVRFHQQCGNFESDQTAYLQCINQVGLGSPGCYNTFSLAGTCFDKS